MRVEETGPRKAVEETKRFLKAVPKAPRSEELFVLGRTDPERVMFPDALMVVEAAPDPTLNESEA